MSEGKEAARLPAGKAGASGARRYKPYPAYKDSGVEWLGEIPAHWEVKRLKRVFAVINGSTPQSGVADYWGGEIAWVTPEDLGELETPEILNTRRRITPEGYRSCGTSLVPAGSLVLSTRAPIGHLAIAGVELCTNQGCRSLVFRRQSVRTFFYYELAAARAELEALGQGGTFRELAKGKLEEVFLAEPTEPEQRAIAAFLDRETARIDALVAKKERLIALLEEQRTALITRAVTKGLDPTVQISGTGSIFFPQIPVGWELRKLRRLLTRVKRPITVDPDSEYREIGIRSWGKGIFHKDAVRGALLEDKSVFSIEPGDFVLNIVFAWEGAVAVATEAERGMVGSHRFPTFRCSEEVELDYLLMLFQTEHGRALMEVNSPGAAGRNKTIRVDQFLDELVPLPPVAQQREIVRRFRSDEVRLGGLVGQLREAIERLKELRTALISAAVTGKIDVREEVALDGSQITQ